MNKSLLSLRSQVLPLCLAAAWVASPGAQATTITQLQANGSYNLPGTGLVTLPTDSATPPGDTSVDVLSFVSDGSGNQSGIHAYGDSNFASFGSRASGSGIYAVTSRIEVTATGVGDIFTSSIIPGRVFLSQPSGYSILPGEFVSAHLQFALYVDGSTTANFKSDASLLYDITGLTSSTFETPGGFSIGYTLNTATDYVSYDFGPSIQTISGLDVLSPSFAGNHTIVYDIFAEAHGVSHAIPCSGGGGGDGQPGVVGNPQNPGDGQGTCQPGSGAQSGDPLPEPASLALFGLGMAALLRSRRQQLRQA